MNDPLPGPADPLDEALVGLFDIARDEHPLDVQAVQSQLEGLPEDERKALLNELVDVDTFGSYLRKADKGATIHARTPGAGFEDDKMEKIDTVLDALARLEHGDEGARSLQALTPDQRVHVLFASIGQR